MNIRLTVVAILLLPLTAQAHPDHDTANWLSLHTLQHGYEYLLLGLGMSAIAWVLLYRAGKANSARHTANTSAPYPGQPTL